MSADGCICPRFTDTGGFRIADLCCPVHGVEGSALYADGMWEDDATPPLVAAPPVPPVVPDSEALADQIPASMPQDGLHWYRRWLVAQQQLDAKFQREVSSASGVVPDKPALDPMVACRDCGEPKQAGGKCCTYWETGWRPNASVPAVTDDEAATKIMALALTQSRYPESWRKDIIRAADGSERQANAVIAALRSAGFLIVHHTKET